MFNALYVTRENGQTQATIRAFDDPDLPQGDVTVRVEYSSLNYKDALALTGTAPVIRTYPLVAGIDLAGVVESSDSPQWNPGDRVVINGWGMGETDWGGLSQKARVPAGWLLRLPEGMSTHHAATIGTAGYTAALCVAALQRHGVQPADGPVLVTGASGGVGSVAIALLSNLGYQVTAATGKPQEEAYLRELGATDVLPRESITAPGKPLQRETWAGAVDTLGSHALANVCAAMKWNGAVAACGLAQGSDLPATVMPFILRGVTLFGINCVYVGNDKRVAAYELLARHVSAQRLETMTSEVGLSWAVEAARELLAGKRKGRTVVDVNR